MRIAQYHKATILMQDEVPTLKVFDVADQLSRIRIQDLTFHAFITDLWRFWQYENKMEKSQESEVKPKAESVRKNEKIRNPASKTRKKVTQPKLPKSASEVSSNWKALSAVSKDI